MTIRRMAIRDASEHFGISADGVRQRIRRGTLESEKDEDGRVYVWVDISAQEPNSVGAHRTGDAGAVEEELRERIASLERQLERRDEELHRAHQLLGESLGQLRAINAPSTEAQQEKEEPQPDEEQLSESLRQEQEGNADVSEGRSWWQRLLGR